MRADNCLEEYTAQDSQNPENRDKNRYPNIVACESCDELTNHFTRSPWPEETAPTPHHWRGYWMSFKCGSFTVPATSFQFFCSTMGPLKYVDARGKCAFMLRPHKLYTLQLSPWALACSRARHEERGRDE